MGLFKRGWIWVLAILVVAGVFAAFRLGKKTDPDYFTAKVEKGDIRQVIEATGTINPVTSVQVGSQVSGMISKLYVDFNSKVTKGQVIAEILVTHEPDIAQFAKREIVFRDGQIKRDDVVEVPHVASEVLNTMPTIED